MLDAGYLILDVYFCKSIFAVDKGIYTNYYCYMKTMEISEIDEILLRLPEDCVKEVKDFADYLFEREKKRQAFTERVSQAKQEPSLEFKSVDDLMKAVREFEE